VTYAVSDLTKKLENISSHIDMQTHDGISCTQPRTRNHTSPATVQLWQTDRQTHRETYRCNSTPYARQRLYSRRG